MCKQASNNVSCACTILQQRHISTCVRVARAPMFVRERRLLAAKWKSTQLWLLTAWSSTGVDRAGQLQWQRGRIRGGNSSYQCDMIGNTAAHVSRAFSKGACIWTKRIECLVAGPVGRLFIRNFAMLQARAVWKFTIGLMRPKTLSP